MVEYYILSTYLGLSQEQRNAFGMLGWAEKKHECLKVWKEMKGNEATYGALITAAEKAKDQKLADAVKAIFDGMCMYTGRDDPWCEYSRPHRLTEIHIEHHELRD